MGRLTDREMNFGPLTIGLTSWKAWYLVFSTGDDNEEIGNNITVYVFGLAIRLVLPTIMRSYREKVKAHWDDATGIFMVKDWYYETHPREYGFCLDNGHLRILLGKSTDDSFATQSWSCFLPWTQWRFYKMSFYDTNGNLFWSQIQEPKQKYNYERQSEAKEILPKVEFEIEDFDGKVITVKTHIEQLEWKFGEKWCSWLSLFRKKKVKRSLDINFSEGVGTGKKSWKGGLISISTDLLPGELHESAFRRFCEKTQQDKEGNYKIKFLRKL